MSTTPMMEVVPTNTPPVSEEYQLVHIPPENLRDWWPIILEGVVLCQKHDSGNPIPEDLYWCLKTNYATLYIGLNGGEYAGFVILQKVENTFDNVPVLHIWHAYNSDKRRVSVSWALDEIVAMARQMGAGKVTLEHSSLSIVKWGEQHGFTVAGVKLAKELK